MQEIVTIPTVFIDVESRLSGFEGIGEGDVVVCDTSHISHNKYYVIKNIAVKRGGCFVQTSCSNVDRLVEEIYRQN